jgi:hypothetical protein
VLSLLSRHLQRASGRECVHCLQTWDLLEQDGLEQFEPLQALPAGVLLDHRGPDERQPVRQVSRRQDQRCGCVGLRTLPTFPNDLYGGCASCPAHSVYITGPFSPEDCACLPGYRMGYNAKALGGSESYTNGLTKMHTYQASPSPDDLLAVFADTLAEVYCNGQLLARIALVQGSYPANPGGACEPPVVFQYGVDVQFDSEVTQTYKQCMPCEKGSYSASGGACLPCPPQTNSTAQSTCLVDVIDMANSMANRADRVAACQVPPPLNSE